MTQETQTTVWSAFCEGMYMAAKCKWTYIVCIPIGVFAGYFL